mmetsp:Transcript_23452/g.62619  ORF Transcript_23452/g.62619 Transcript_23452/m.62619 type:complete len:416 (+) Transcript_23452:296-1543(+)
MRGTDRAGQLKYTRWANARLEDRRSVARATRGRRALLPARTAADRGLLLATPARGAPRRRPAPAGAGAYKVTGRDEGEQREGRRARCPPQPAPSRGPGRPLAQVVQSLGALPAHRLGELLRELQADARPVAVRVCPRLVRADEGAEEHLRLAVPVGGALPHVLEQREHHNVVTAIGGSLGVALAIVGRVGRLHEAVEVVAVPDVRRVWRGVNHLGCLRLLLQAGHGPEVELGSRGGAGARTGPCPEVALHLVQDLVDEHRLLHHGADGLDEILQVEVPLVLEHRLLVLVLREVVVHFPPEALSLLLPELCCVASPVRLALLHARQGDNVLRDPPPRTLVSFRVLELLLEVEVLWGQLLADDDRIDLTNPHALTVFVFPAPTPKTFDPTAWTVFRLRGPTLVFTHQTTGLLERRSA